VTSPQQRREDDHQLPEVVRRLEELITEFRDWRRIAETTYVRQDVYKAQRQGDQQTVKELRGDLNVIAEQQQWNRRIAVSGLLLPILVIVFGAVILAAVGLR
jgi:hypothetical protein